MQRRQAQCLPTCLPVQEFHPWHAINNSFQNATPKTKTRSWSSKSNNHALPRPQSTKGKIPGFRLIQAQHTCIRLFARVNLRPVPWTFPSAGPQLSAFVMFKACQGFYKCKLPCRTPNPSHEAYLGGSPPRVPQAQPPPGPRELDFIRGACLWIYLRSGSAHLS